MWAQILTSRQLDVVTSSFKTKVVLDESIIEGNIEPDSTTMQTLRAQLVQMQSDTLTRKPESIQEIEWFNQVQGGARQADRADGRLSAPGRAHRVGTDEEHRQAAGGNTRDRRRSPAMNALGNPAGTPVEIQSLVHSKYP